QLEGESPNYNIVSAVRLTGKLEVAALKQSLSEIERRHEVLRTRFATVEGKALQIISEENRMELEIVDLSSYPAEQRETEAEKIGQAEAERAFSLREGPLVRAKLMMMQEQEQVLVIVMDRQWE